MQVLCQERTTVSCLVFLWFCSGWWSRQISTEGLNYYLGNTQIQRFISCFLCCCSFFRIFFSLCKDCVRKGLHDLQSNCSLGAFCYVKTFLINVLLHFHLKMSWWETHFKFFYQAKLDWKPSLLWKQLSDFPELVLDTQKLKKCFSSAPECIQGN